MTTTDEVLDVILVEIETKYKGVNNSKILTIFHSIKLNGLEKRLALLIKQYQAANQQLLKTLEDKEAVM